jgi:hypothetical protein
MKQHKLFGRAIQFDVSFSRAVYIKNEMSDRTYEGMVLDIVKPKETIDGPKYGCAYRKLLFQPHKTMDGIIIGQTKKIEGWYTPGSSAYNYGATGYSEPEPPMFEPRKTHTFWVVATSMNVTYLVEKGLFV